MELGVYTKYREVATCKEVAIGRSFVYPMLIRIKGRTDKKIKPGKEQP